MRRLFPYFAFAAIMLVMAVAFTPPALQTFMTEITTMTVAFTPPIPAEVLVLVAVAVVLMVVSVWNFTTSVAVAATELGNQGSSRMAPSGAGDGGRSLRPTIAVMFILILAAIDALMRRTRDLGHTLVGHRKSDCVSTTPNPA